MATINAIQRSFPRADEVQSVLQGLSQVPAQTTNFIDRSKQMMRRAGTDMLGNLNAKELISKPVSTFFEEIRPSLKGLAGAATQAAQEGVAKIFPKGQYNVTQGFGNVNEALYSGITKGARHLGLDIGTPQGTELKLPVGGKVRVGIDPKGYGAWVEVQSEDGAILRFSHLSQINPYIAKAAKEGARVGAGMIFGLSGGLRGTAGAGNTTGAHLDISAKVGGKNVDPLSVPTIKQALYG